MAKTCYIYVNARSSVNAYVCGIVPLATVAADAVILLFLKRHLVFFAAKDAAILFFF